jgi:hypothetical protein
VKDVDASTNLVTEVITLMGNEDLRNKLRGNIAGLGRTDADEKIAGIVLGLIKR